MSRILDQAACSDAQRREDLARNDAAQRAVDGLACRAKGKHLSGANDEPEPTQADWVLFDAERDADKGPRLAARNDARAIEWQLIDFRARGIL